MKDDTDVKFTFVKDGVKLIVPVTPGIDETINGTYVIKLTDGNQSLLLVSDKHQHWFRGIVTNTGQRFEIDEKIPLKMKGSNSLNTPGIYPRLLDKDLATLRLGYQQILSAFYTLVRYGEGRRDFALEKESIAVILVMFFEGPRFLPVFELNKNALSQQMDIELGETNEDLIRNWCDTSKAFYAAEKEEDEAGNVVISDNTSDTVKFTAKNLRIMCCSEWDASAINKHGHPAQTTAQQSRVRGAAAAVARRRVNKYCAR